MEEKREGSRSLSQQEEDALQSIARSDLGGLFKARMDEGFTLLYANDSYYAIHGYTRGQLEQEMHGQAVGLVHPEDVAWVSEHLRRALAENQGTVSFEYRIVRRDGAVVWLLISAGLSQEDGGMVLSGMILDITARKAMDASLFCETPYASRFSFNSVFQSVSFSKNPSILEKVSTRSVPVDTL